MQAAIQHIVFDWNSTLLDDFDAVLTSFNLLFQHYGKSQVSAELYRDRYAIPFTALFRNHGFTETELTAVGAESKQLFHNYYEPRAERAPLRDGAVELLKRLHKAGIKCLILSNHVIGSITAHLRRLNIEDYFSEILAYADIDAQFRDMTKGEKLQRYLSDNRIDPAHTLIIGDSVEEIDIARQQSLTGVALTGGCVSEQRLRDAQPDYLIHRLSELAPILTERGAAL